jgi:hypothetical protein
MKIQMMLLREVPYVNSLSTNRRAARQKRGIKTSTAATDGAIREREAVGIGITRSRSGSRWCVRVRPAR